MLIEYWLENKIEFVCCYEYFNENNMKYFLLLIIFLLQSCAGPGKVGIGPLTNVIDIENLDSVTRQRVDAIKIIDDKDTEEIKFLKKVKTTSCKNQVYDPPASRQNAVEQLKYMALENNADAIKNVICTPKEGTSFVKNCWESITCSGDLVLIGKSSNEYTDNSRKNKTQITIDSNELKIDSIKKKQETDAVAIIIGIQNYKKIPKSNYSNDDARVFAEYANKVLGVKQQNIKVLIDDEADNAEIYRAFQNWLPIKVKKNKTDIYVFYSGHGLPSDDGNSLFFLPHGADRDFISKTAINQSEIIAALQATQPNSVTMFIDSCYSGLTRTGDALLASARPVVIKSKNVEYPTNFTVISASSPEQISWSSAELKHGIFSYYLMKGMEGDADENKDGKITASEMQTYLADMVPRQAMTMNRKQMPQLTGDANRVLVGR